MNDKVKLSLGLLAVVMTIACSPAATPTPTPRPPLPTPQVVRLEEAIGENDLDSRELQVSWEDLAGGGLEFRIPITCPSTDVLFRVPQSVDILVQCSQLASGDVGLLLRYVNDEEEKDHQIRPHPWKTPRMVELLIDATWQRDSFYVLDVKAWVEPDLELVICLYGSR